MPDQTTALLSPTDQLALLADAISDIGYWSWWTAALPDTFQLEFGGTQLYFPPTSTDKPPQTQIALQFRQPTSISFLSRREGAEDFAWSQLLHEDQLEAPGCSHEEFGFGDADFLKSLLDQATHYKVVHGYEPMREAFLHEPYQLVFWCGEYGLAIAAQSLRLLTHQGEVALDQLADVHRQWWDYWRSYWDKRDTPDALPKDYACEVTIPLKG